MLPQNLDELYEHLRYSPGRRPRIAAHRGAPEAGEAENCLATFERALARGALFMEVDIRETRDGQFVLHHDARLARTTTGEGALSDHTLAELQSLRLRDLSGAPTPHAMPTLRETIAWARGRALLYIDVKPPLELAAVQRFLHTENAEHLCVTLTYDLRDTLAVHRESPRAAVYAMVPEERRVRELLACGIPARQLVASVQEHTPREMYDLLHEHGISVDYPAWAGTDRRAAQSGHSVYLPALALGSDLFNTDDVTRVARAIDEVHGPCGSAQ